MEQIQLGDYNNWHMESEEKEYMCEVEWICTVDRDKAFFKRKSNIFTPISVKASMQYQGETVQQISEYFNVDIIKLLQDK